MILGAAWVSVLAIWVGRAERVPGEEIGARAQELRTFIEGHFGPELHRFAVAIVAFALAEGASLGLVAHALMTWRDRISGRRPRGPYLRALEALGLVVALHTLTLAWGMAHSPGLYAKAFYARGGALRLAQILISDGLRSFGVGAIAAVGLVAYLAGPRAGWGAWPSRMRGLAASRWSHIAAFGLVVWGASHLLAAVDLSPRSSANASGAPPSAPQMSRADIAEKGGH